VGGKFYKQLGGTNWVSNVLLTSVIFCGPVLGVFFCLNAFALLYRVSEGKSERSEGRVSDVLGVFSYLNTVALLYRVSR
jgi:hypothetical protein